MMQTQKKLSMKEKHPELFLPQTNIDRRQQKRVVPMEVMNLGFPRTGTMCKSANILACASTPSFLNQCLPNECQLK